MSKKLHAKKCWIAQSESKEKTTSTNRMSKRRRVQKGLAPSISAPQVESCQLGPAKSKENTGSKGSKKIRPSKANNTMHWTIEDEMKLRFNDRRTTKRKTTLLPRNASKANLLYHQKMNATTKTGTEMEQRSIRRQRVATKKPKPRT